MEETRLAAGGLMDTALKGLGLGQAADVIKDVTNTAEGIVGENPNGTSKVQSHQDSLSDLASASDEATAVMGDAGVSPEEYNVLYQKFMPLGWSRQQIHDVVGQSVQAGVNAGMTAQQTLAIVGAMAHKSVTRPDSILNTIRALASIIDENADVKDLLIQTAVQAATGGNYAANLQTAKAMISNFDHKNRPKVQQFSQILMMLQAPSDELAALVHALDVQRMRTKQVEESLAIELAVRMAPYVSAMQGEMQQMMNGFRTRTLPVWFNNPMVRNQVLPGLMAVSGLLSLKSAYLRAAGVGQRGTLEMMNPGQRKSLLASNRKLRRRTVEAQASGAAPYVPGAANTPAASNPATNPAQVQQGIQQGQQAAYGAPGAGYQQAVQQNPVINKMFSELDSLLLATVDNGRGGGAFATYKKQKESLNGLIADANGEPKVSGIEGVGNMAAPREIFAMCNMMLNSLGQIKRNLAHAMNLADQILRVPQMQQMQQGTMDGPQARAQSMRSEIQQTMVEVDNEYEEMTQVQVIGPMLNDIALWVQRRKSLEIQGKQIQTLRMNKAAWYQQYSALTQEIVARRQNAMQTFLQLAQASRTEGRQRTLLAAAEKQQQLIESEEAGRLEQMMGIADISGAGIGSATSYVAHVSPGLGRQVTASEESDECVDEAEGAKITEEAMSEEGMRSGDAQDEDSVEADAKLQKYLNDYWGESIGQPQWGDILEDPERHRGRPTNPRLRGRRRFKR